MPRKGILERLREGVVSGDGGYILELERRGYVQAGPYTPEVAVEHPEALRELMAGRKLESTDAPRFATGDRNW
jgi:hypothetical protein